MQDNTFGQIEDAAGDKRTQLTHECCTSTSPLNSVAQDQPIVARGPSVIKHPVEHLEAAPDSSGKPFTDKLAAYTNLILTQHTQQTSQ